jgi:HEAT repeat protein
MKSKISLALLLTLLAIGPAKASFPTGDWAADTKAEKAERAEEEYDEGQDALDESDWRRAVRHFNRVIEMNAASSDAALYWKAYAQNKMGQRAEALASLVELQKNHGKSKWASDGRALELEIRQSAGQTIKPEKVDDEEIKLMAVNSLMHSDPSRAIPLLEKILSSQTQSLKVKERALFVLSQSQSTQAFEILGRIAKGGAHPELQSRALKYLGIAGGERSRVVLQDVYNGTSDVRIKKSVLKSYMVSGDRGRLLALAKSEPNAELRGEAISQLGIIGARSELADLYTTEQSIELRKKIIQAMFIGGNADKLYDIARNEKNQELRITAIRNMGLLGGGKTATLLNQLYETDSSPEVRRAVINGLFLQGNAKSLVALARKEKDREMRKEIVQKLSLINSPDATEFLVELLNE